MSHRDVVVRPPQEAAYGPFARHPLVAAAVFLAAVHVTSTTALLSAPPESDVAVWWPAAGISVAMLVLVPARPRVVLAAGVLLVSALANYGAGRGLASSVGFGLSNAAESWLVAWWLTRGTRGRPALRTMDDSGAC